MEQNDYARLAKQFTENAVSLKSGDKLLINTRGRATQDMAQAMKAHAEGLGATVQVADCGSATINKIFTKNPKEADVEAYSARELALMQSVDCYIGLGDDADMKKFTNPQAYRAAINEGLRHRVDHTRWVITRAPTASFAKACGMTLPEFEDFYLKACLLDYNRMAKAVVPLQDLMDRSEHVRITGPGTDLEFSIKGLKSQPCVGARNIPDGECYTAPEKHSVNGRIAFGPSTYLGESFSRIVLEYNGGYISSAIAGDEAETEALNRILDTDAGARFTGEFAIGFHPHITKPVGNILFDEKIGGSIHIAQGQAYKGDTDNGNESQVHWDMVHSQRPEHGGGRLFFDDKLIRVDGRFVVPDLEGLNPENLM